MNGFEGSEFYYDSTGYYMTIFLRGISLSEVEAIHNEALYHFALTTVGPVVFVLVQAVLPPKPTVCRFIEHIIFGSAGPYSWHLVPMQLRPKLENMGGLAQSSHARAVFQVTVVDSLSNTVQAIRFVTLSSEFTAAFHKTVSEQARQDFNSADYRNHLAATCRKYTTKQLFRMASVRCVGGQDEHKSSLEASEPSEKDSQESEPAENTCLSSPETLSDTKVRVKTIERNILIADDNNYGLRGIMPHRPVLVPYEVSSADLASRVAQVKSIDELYSIIESLSVWVPDFEYWQLESSEVVDSVLAQIGSDTIKLFIVREAYYSEVGLQLPDEVERKALFAARLLGLT
ncbi:MAG: hypothetical protein EOP06_08260 [Proteobacteria bacterium]|nr:MAG: hypothetical protein EOP06_08260 [Pseudomonadota bacterium]